MGLEPNEPTQPLEPGASEARHPAERSLPPRRRKRKPATSTTGPASSGAAVPSAPPTASDSTMLWDAPTGWALPPPPSGEPAESASPPQRLPRSTEFDTSAEFGAGLWEAAPELVASRAPSRPKREVAETPRPQPDIAATSAEFWERQGAEPAEASSPPLDRDGDSTGDSGASAVDASPAARASRRNRRRRRGRKKGGGGDGATNGAVTPSASPESGRELAEIAAEPEAAISGAAWVVREPGSSVREDLSATMGTRPPGSEAPSGGGRGRRRGRRRRGGRNGAAVSPPLEAAVEEDLTAPSPGGSVPAVAPVAVEGKTEEPGEPARKSRRRARPTKGRKSSAPRATPSPAETGTGGSAPELASEKASDEAIALGEPAVSPLAVVTSADQTPRGPREMIINVTPGEECRIAILCDRRLEELHLERQSAESHVGNIYKGRITNVEPSIQAAFVDFGMAKNGFLHISDVQPRYFPDGQGEPENVGKKVPRRDRPPIHKCFRRGQEVIVQITKEGVGTKGPTLTTYLSIPGRYLVMMPGMSRLGVSRKIEDEGARHEMRAVLNELSLPSGMGFILRTAGLNRTKRDLQRDLNYLKRLWKIVEERIRSTRAPAELYQESDLVIRTIRDLYNSDFDRIVIDHEPAAQKAREFMQLAMPRSHDVIQVYKGRKPVFHEFGIEDEIERINSRHVPLPGGGSLVIESTEAMVTIDVNSGKFRALDDAEETAFQINVEAAKEIARQLRLRDLGGLVVCDFIDMRMDRHKRAVERTLRDELKKHKERARLLRMSQFGLIEMTRQRQRPSIKRSIYTDCPHCRGTGVVKTLETMVLEVLRALQLAVHKPDVAHVLLRVAHEVAATVLNQRRAALRKLEQETDTTITIQADLTYGVDQMTHEFRDPRGRIIPGDLT